MASLKLQYCRVKSSIRAARFSRWRVCSYLAFSAITLSLSASEIPLKTGSLDTAVNEKGLFTRLKDSANNKDYLLNEIPSPLITIRMFGAEEELLPISLKELTSTGKSHELHAEFANQISVKVMATEKQDYLVFEVLSVNAPDKVELLSWGPVNTTIVKTIGSCVGVVRDDDFALGIQCLNVKTLAGYSVGTRDRYGNAAQSMEAAFNEKRSGIKDGSRLQAFSMNLTRGGVIDNRIQKAVKVPAVKGETVAGSKIAVFGCPAKDVLKVISDVELGEGLPHPLIEGKWGKTSRKANETQFWTNFNVKNIDECIAMAGKAGVKILYSGHMWQSWGTFEPNKSDFPNGISDVQKCVAKAQKAGIKLGAHTLASFIMPSDPMVTPIPDADLAVQGVTVLAKDIDMTAKQIVLGEDAPLVVYEITKEKTDRHYGIMAIRIGNELIEYGAVSKTTPLTLLECNRGAFNTAKMNHRKGDKVSKLISHPYKVFFPDLDLARKMAVNLATVFNKTGLKAVSLDGFEGHHTGLRAYQQEVFGRTFYDNLKSKDVIITASDTPHNFWHILSNVSWGEPWNDEFREAMMDYRFKQVDFLNDNYIPKKLGQYNFSKAKNVADIEWILARCAGFDALFDCYITPDAVKKNPHGDKMLAAMKKWQTAMAEDAFTAEQKTLLRDPSREFTLQLEKNKKWHLAETGKWKKESKPDNSNSAAITLDESLFHDTGKKTPAEVSKDYKHVSFSRETGEPTLVEWKYHNKFKTQPLQFVLRLPAAANEKISNPYFAINGVKKAELPLNIVPGQYLVGNGEGITLYSKEGSVVSTLQIQLPSLTEGDNLIGFDYKRSNQTDGPEVIVNFRLMK